MKIPEPKFNLCTPNNIKRVFKTNKKEFSKRLFELLGTKKVSSVRLQTLGMNDNELVEISNYLKRICKNEVPVLIENCIGLCTQLKLDGVHLTSGERSVKKAKSILSKNQVIGAFCGLSKHSGLLAAEEGADYIAFEADYHNVKASEKYLELFQWWSKFIQIPVMGECSNNCMISRDLWNYSDFFSIGNKIWCLETSIESYLKPV